MPEYIRNSESMVKLLLKKTIHDVSYHPIREILQNSIEHGQATIIHIKYDEKSHILQIIENKGKGITIDSVTQRLGLQFNYNVSNTFSQFRYGRDLLLNITDIIEFHIHDGEKKYVYINEMNKHDFDDSIICERTTTGITVKCELSKDAATLFSIIELEKYIKEWFEYQIWDKKYTILINDKEISSPDIIGTEYRIIEFELDGANFELRLIIDVKRIGARGIRVLSNEFYIGEMVNPPHSSIKIIGFLKTGNVFSDFLSLSKQLQKNEFYRKLVIDVYNRLSKILEPYLEKEQRMSAETALKKIIQIINKVKLPGELNSKGNLKMGKFDPSKDYPNLRKHNYPPERQPPSIGGGIDISFIDLGLDNRILIGEGTGDKKRMIVNLSYPLIKESWDTHSNDWVTDLEAEIIREYLEIIQYLHPRSSESQTHINKLHLENDHRRFLSARQEAS